MRRRSILIASVILGGAWWSTSAIGVESEPLMELAQKVCRLYDPWEALNEDLQYVWPLLGLTLEPQSVVPVKEEVESSDVDVLTTPGIKILEALGGWCSGRHALQDVPIFLLFKHMNTGEPFAVTEVYYYLSSPNGELLKAVHAKYSPQAHNGSEMFSLADSNDQRLRADFEKEKLFWLQKMNLGRAPPK